MTKKTSGPRPKENDYFTTCYGCLWLRKKPNGGWKCKLHPNGLGPLSGSDISIYSGCYYGKPRSQRAEKELGELKSKIEKMKLQLVKIAEIGDGDDEQ